MSDPDDTSSEPRQVEATSFKRALWFLLPVGEQRADARTCRPGAIHWLVPIGLLIGVVYAAIFGGVWSVYGEYFGLRLLPAAMLLVADVAFLGNRLIRGLCATADEIVGSGEESRRDLRPAILVFVLWLLVKLALLLALPRGQQWGPGDWRRYWMFLYPQPVLRPLILMAIWGRWAILLAMSLGRPSGAEGNGLPAMMARARLGIVLAWLAPTICLTVLYCSVAGNIAVGLLVAGITLAVVYLCSVAFSWRLGGQTTASVYAAGAIGEMAFLSAYVPFASRILGW